MVEYDIYKAFQNGQKSTNPDAVNKEREKEAEDWNNKANVPPVAVQANLPMAVTHAQFAMGRERLFSV